MRSVTWNLWHGCHKISTGCKHCYVYRSDAKYDRNSAEVHKTQNFNLPVKKDRSGKYKIPSGTCIYTCFTSDFLLEDADVWRQEAWAMIRERSDCTFLFITKRIDRLMQCVPPDWGDGYDNVVVCCTVENQERADYRLPYLLSAKAKHKEIVCSPLLESIDLERFLTSEIEGVTAAGESGAQARICDYNWILQIRAQCVRQNIPFWFQQTGAHFQKDGRLYTIPRREQHSQARKANINTGKRFYK